MLDSPVSPARIEVAIAILHQDDRFLMQLRDNIPSIIYPGVWAFFGGHIEPGETPEEAVVREVQEEVGYAIPSVEKFGIYDDEKVIRHVFHAPLTVEFEQLVLSEGWDMKLVSREEIDRGECYSSIADQVRPLGQKHQRILLDFIEQKSM